MKKTTSTRFSSTFLIFPDTSEKRNPSLFNKLFIESSENVINSCENTELFSKKIRLSNTCSSMGISPAIETSFIFYISPSKISTVIKSSCLFSEIVMIELFTEKLR